MAGGAPFDHEVREAEDRLGHVSQEKRHLERRVQELQTLNERRERCVERRERLVRSLDRAVAELQHAGEQESLRAERLREAGVAIRQLRSALESLQGAPRVGDGTDWATLSEDGRHLAEIEAKLAAELDRLEALEEETGGGVAWDALTGRRRGFVEWIRLGMVFFLPVVVVALLAALLVVGFAGLE
jgi:DNA repair exonuclease SbcCD ATPase subunit